jgi:hypothetical protein
VLSIQNRVKNCLRLTNIRKSFIAELPAAAISQSQDRDKESPASVSIFQSKSTRKLGKHTRQLVNLSMEAFKPQSIAAENSIGGFGRQNRQSHFTAESSAAILIAASPLRHALPSVTSRSKSTTEWVAAQDKASSDED